MLKDYEIKALEHNLLDYNAWAIHAVNEGIYPDTETALHAKAARCAERMIKEHESKNSKFSSGLTLEEKIDTCHGDVKYKNRVARDAEMELST